MKSIFKRVTVGVALGGALLVSAGMGTANATPGEVGPVAFRQNDGAAAQAAETVEQQPTSAPEAATPTPGAAAPASGGPAVG